MVSEEEISQQADRMRDAIGAAYGFRARNLAGAIRRAGRRLPKTVRAELSDIQSAQHLGGNPKLLKRIDVGRLKAAETLLRAHLKTIDRTALRKKALVGWAAQVSFNILLVAGGIVTWMVWSGRI